MYLLFMDESGVGDLAHRPPAGQLEEDAQSPYVHATSFAIREQYVQHIHVDADDPHPVY